MPPIRPKGSTSKASSSSFRTKKEQGNKKSNLEKTTTKTARKGTSSSVAQGSGNKERSKKTVIAPPVSELERLSLIDGVTAQKAVRKGKALPRIGARQEKKATTTSSVSTLPQKEGIAKQEITNTTSEDQAEGKRIHLESPIMIKALAELMEVKPFKIIHDLMEMNIFANINQSLEPEVAVKLCQLYGFTFGKEEVVEEVEMPQGEEDATVSEEADAADASQDTGKNLEKKSIKKAGKKSGKKSSQQDDSDQARECSSSLSQEELQPRAPIITFMGHVDHGKTSLLDAIRRTKVASGEAGGITQRIGAYMIERNGQAISFIDTPGHAAFTAMRARGAQVTDIVVLVVAANDGLMPQTLEALDHARAANVALIVAINKVDIPGVKLDRVKQQLQENGLTPEEWGGDTICCEVSAATGQGIEDLLEMMLLQAEMLELKANPRGPATAYVIEAEFQPGRGPTATVIVNSGTLKVGDPVLCGNYWGKVKQLINDMGEPIKKAPPATPVKIFGLSGLPNAGDELVVIESDREARSVSEARLQELRQEKLAAPKKATLENLFDNLEGGEKKKLEIVLKADMQGSLEAIKSTLADIPQSKIELKITHAGVGPVNESDVLLASASNAVIIGFGVKLENAAANAARREGIQVKLFSIIYELIDQVREAMSGMLEPELRENIIGHAEVKQVFKLSRGFVGGSFVTDGRIARAARARVVRRRQAIYDGGFSTLRRFTEDVKEVKAGLECGIRLGDFSEYEVGDIIECYELEKIPQNL